MKNSAEKRLPKYINGEKQNDEQIEPDDPTTYLSKNSYTKIILPSIMLASDMWTTFVV